MAEKARVVNRPGRPVRGAVTGVENPGKIFK